MEICRQCGNQAETHPIIAVMKAKEDGFGKPLSESFGFAAYSLCVKCHQSPTLKAHFYTRQDLQIAMRLVDMPSLALPGAARP